MQVNTNKWGQSDTWTVATALTPSSGATDDTNLFYYHGIFNSLGDYVDNNIFEYGTVIDDTICYGAHAAAEKMPLADVEYINYNGVPVGEQKNDAGWFLSYKTSSAANLPYYDAYVLISQMGGTTIQGELSRCYRWCPAGLAQDTTHNPRPTNYHQELAPIVQFSPRSAFYVIMVELITLDHKTRTTITLKTLADNFATYAGTYYISRAYMIPYTYRGRNANNPTQFNDYAAFSSRYFGASMINGISFETGEVISYYQTVGRGGSLPIIGVSYTEKLDSTHYGTRVFKRQSSGVNEFYVPVYSRNKVSTISTIHYGTANENYMAYVETDVYIGIVDDIIRGAAAYGLFFTDDTYNDIISDTTNEQRWINENMYLGVLDENGVGHGEYTKGIYNITNPIFDYDTSQDSPYNPKKDIDPNTYSDTTNWNNVDFRQAFTKRYLLTGSQVAGLASELWAAQSSKPADIDYHNFAIDEYLTNNPIDTIVSLKYFPCTFTDTAPAVVHLGKYTTNIAATALGTSVRIIDFAPIECFPHFNDFRDYEPYTEIAMYIPFCGTVKIPTAECMGNYVSVKLAIDTNTGAATGYIIVSKTGSGGICVATCQGMAAIDIPVSGLQSANLANAVFNATANWTQTQINNISANSGLFKNTSGVMGAIARGMSDSVKLSDVKGGILGGPIGAVGSLVNRLNPISALQSGLSIDIENAKADYELSHIQVPTRLVGSASPALGCVIELDCRLIIYRPVTDETALSNYADTVGYATVQGGMVSGFSGFTVGTIDVSGINATAKEKQAIAAAFANGVYL